MTTSVGYSDIAGAFYLDRTDHVVPTAPSNGHHEDLLTKINKTSLELLQAFASRCSPEHRMRRPERF